MNNARLNILDGFRCVAIVAVLFFHFYSKWTLPVPEENYLPGKNVFHTFAFEHGNLGVQFFFIISGFVIFFTLERSHSLIAFLIKRMIKLFPTMVICSLITYLLVPMLDPSLEYPNFHSNAIDFAPSLTFTPPSLWQRILHNPSIQYINGSYWSLWPEVVFYFVSAGTYFLNKEKFIRNWFVIIFAALLVNTVALAVNGWNLDVRPFLPGTRNHLYFSLGIIFYCLYNRRHVPTFSYLTLALLGVFTLMYSDTAQKIALVVMIGLFLLFIYKEEYLSFFKWRLFTSVGLVSYSLYLIHENIGVVLINKITDFTGVNFFIYVLPLLVSALFFAFSIILFNVYEKPVDKFLKTLFRKQLHPINKPVTSHTSAKEKVTAPAST